MSKLLRSLSFGIAGFCLAWLLSAAFFSEALQRASASAFTEDARRFVSAKPIEPSLLESCLTAGTVLYCDAGEQTDLRGVWLAEGSSLSYPMKEGVFLTPEESRGTDPLAVVGSLVATEADRVSVDGTEYRVIGSVGVPDVFTPLDTLILVPLRLGARLLAETGSPLEYTLDGPRTGIEASARNLEAAGISVALAEPRLFSLGDLRAGPLPASWTYILFAALTGLLLALFAWFEVRNRSRDILAYEAAGATKTQTFRMLVGSYLRYPLIALGSGALLAWLAQAAGLRRPLDCRPLLGALAVAFACVTAAAILARRQLGRAAREENAPSPWVRRVVSFAPTVTTAFLLLFLNVLGQTGARHEDVRRRLETMEGYEFCQLIADQTPEEFDRFMTEPSAISRLKGAHEELRNQDHYAYVTRMRQPVHFDASRLPAEFLDFPDAKDDVRALQASESYFSLMGLEAERGRDFEANDFVDDGRDVVPVILGSAYAPYYDVGDIIREVEYLFRDCSLEVVGVLPQGAFENLFGYPESLDHTILMPAAEYVLEPAYGSNEWEHQRWAYGQKTDGGGYLVGRDTRDRAGMTLMLAEISARYGIWPFVLGGGRSNPGKMFTAMSGVYADATRVAVLLASALTILLYAQAARYRFETEKSRFEAYRLSGATFGQLLWQTTRQILPDLLLANFAAWILTSVFLGLPYAWQIFAGSVGVALVCVAAAMRKAVRKEFIG